MTQRFFADGGINHGQEGINGFEQHGLRAQARPDAAQLNADDAGPDDAEPLGHGGEVERVPRVDDELTIVRGNF